jgi:hypothetical protein
MWNFIAFTFCLAFVLALPHTKELSQSLKEELDRKGETINIKESQIDNVRLEIGKKNHITKNKFKLPMKFDVQ